MKKTKFTLAFLILHLTMTPLTMAQMSVEEAHLAMNGRFRRGCWTEVRVQIQNRGGHIRGVVEAIVQNVLTFRQAAEFPAFSSTRVSIPIIINSHVPRITLRIVSGDRVILDEMLEVFSEEVPHTKPFVILDRNAPWAGNACEFVEKSGLACVQTLSGDELQDQIGGLEAVDVIISASENFPSEETQRSPEFSLWKAKGGMTKRADSFEDCINVLRGFTVTRREIDGLRPEEIEVFELPDLPPPHTSRIIEFILVYLVSASIIVLLSLLHLRSMLAVLSILVILSAGASAIVFLLIMGRGRTICETLSVLQTSPERHVYMRQLISLSARLETAMNVTLMGRERLRPLYYQPADAVSEHITFEFEKDATRILATLRPGKLLCFEREKSLPAPPAIRLSLRQQHGEPRYLITNESAFDLDQLFLVYGENVWKVGKLNHGQTREISQFEKPLSLEEYLATEFDRKKKSHRYLRALTALMLQSPCKVDIVTMVGISYVHIPESPFEPEGFLHIESYPLLILSHSAPED